MVAIHPFRALRYNPDVVGDLSRVIAPPYDVIGSQEQDALYAASPFNIVRLILGKTSASDSDQDNRYTRAARDFDQWRKQEALRVDAQPALYVIEHRFQDGGETRSRLGFLGLFELRDAARDVHRHEVTLSAPKQDRTKLLEAIPANLSPIFCVFPDEGRTVQAVLERVKSDAPAAVEAVLQQQPIRLWAVTDPATIASITKPLASRAVLIADGHHRFEVAYAQRERYGALMSYFVSMEDPALRVRPIHRIIARGAGNPALMKTFCRLEPADDADAVLRWLNAGTEEGRFGYLEGRACYQATILPDRLARWLMSPPMPLPVAKLDVSILHGLILPGLGVPASAAHTGSEGAAVRYTGDAAEAVKAVSEGHAAWLLRGIPLTQVYALAAHGMTLSPKSTYFYPKVPSGLAINPLTPAAPGQD